MARLCDLTGEEPEREKLNGPSLNSFLLPPPTPSSQQEAGGYWNPLTGYMGQAPRPQSRTEESKKIDL